jgi:hypothetical protein
MSLKQQHIEAKLDIRDLQYLEVNRDHTEPTRVQCEFGGKVYFISID